MPRFAANLTLLFQEVPLLDRFAAAHAAGFEAVEVLFPYSVTPDTFKSALDQVGQTLVLFNTPAPDWANGDRGLAAVPGKEHQFRETFAKAMQYAEVLKPRFLHIMAGLASGADARQTYVENLIWAAAMSPDQSLTIEPINPTDMPGYFLNDFDLAAEILDEVAAPNLHLQFDAYHAHKITGDVIGAWADHGRRAVHVQIAGAEGRHEPDNCEIDYLALFSLLDTEKYGGFVSGEYVPKGHTEEGLGWFTSQL